MIVLVTLQEVSKPYNEMLLYMYLNKKILGDIMVINIKINELKQETKRNRLKTLILFGVQIHQTI